jgi:hypothetical protein
VFSTTYEHRRELRAASHATGTHHEGNTATGNTGRAGLGSARPPLPLPPAATSHSVSPPYRSGLARAKARRFPSVPPAAAAAPPSDFMSLRALARARPGGAAPNQLQPSRAMPT